MHSKTGSEDDMNKTKKLSKNTFLYRGEGLMDKKKKQAEELKKEGNDHFGKKEYKEAWSKYTSAIAIDPMNSVLYSNRAAASLALKSYREAELDCSIAVNLDKDFGKGLPLILRFVLFFIAPWSGFFRRAQARKGQQKYEEAMFDAKRAKELSPGKAVENLISQIMEEQEQAKKKENVQTAKTEKKEDEVGTKISEEKTNKISPVQNSSKNKVFESVEKKEETPKLAKRNIKLVAPKTSYEFESTFSNVKSDTDALCEYLSLLDVKMFGSIVGNCFSEDLLRTLCDAFERETFDGNLGKEMLLSLLREPRCEMIIAFLGDELKGRFSKIF